MYAIWGIKIWKRKASTLWAPHLFPTASRKASSPVEIDLTGNRSSWFWYRDEIVCALNKRNQNLGLTFFFLLTTSNLGHPVHYLARYHKSVAEILQLKVANCRLSSKTRNQSLDHLCWNHTNYAETNRTHERSCVAWAIDDHYAPIFIICLLEEKDSHVLYYRDATFWHFNSSWKRGHFKILNFSSFRLDQIINSKTFFSFRKKNRQYGH